MVQYWRQVGITWLQYATFCARLVRNSVKPDTKKKIAERDTILFSVSQWSQGAKGTAGIHRIFR